MFTKLKSPIVYIALMMLCGFAIRYFFLNTQEEDGGKQSTQTLFAASFPDENGHARALNAYAGKTVVLNFWATWCEPCREEMPELSLLHDSIQSKNAVVLGLAVDDVAAINEFSKENKVSYPLFAGDMQGMELASQLGNNKGVLPFTVIIKADGTIHKVYFGRVTKALLEKSLSSLL